MFCICGEKNMAITISFFQSHIGHGSEDMQSNAYIHKSLTLFARRHTCSADFLYLDNAGPVLLIQYLFQKQLCCKKKARPRKCKLLNNLKV